MAREASSTGGIAARTGREEVIPVAEEQMRVGKREVGHGRVRIRSYTVETPIKEQVGLREEHVTLERRPLDRSLTAADSAALFRDRTIEAEEHAEEAVIAKDVRIKEEIALGKNVEQRTQTVSDKVRHTEVEVVDERGNKVVPSARKVPRGFAKDEIGRVCPGHLVSRINIVADDHDPRSRAEYHGCPCRKPDPDIAVVQSA